MEEEEEKEEARDKGKKGRREWKRLESLRLAETNCPNCTAAV